MMDSNSKQGASTSSMIAQMAAQDIFQRTAISPFTHPFLLLIFAMGYSIGEQHPLISFGSITLLTSVSFSRFLLAKRCNRSDLPYDKKNILWYKILLALHHLVFSFSVSAGLIFYQASFESGILMLFVTVAAATGTFSLSIRHDVHFISMVCMMLPPTVTTFLFSDYDPTIFLFSTSVYLLFLIQMGFGVHKNFYSNAMIQLDLAKSNKQLKTLDLKLNQATVEKKGAKEKQQYAEDYLLEFFERSLDPIAITRDRNIIFVNAATEIFFGQKRENLLQLRFDELIPRKYLQIISDLNDNTALGNTPILEIGYTKRDGTEIYGDTRWVPIIFENQASTFVSIRDLSLQRKREADVRRSEKQFKLMAERNPEPMLVSSKGKFSFANNAALELSGYTFKELSGNPVDKLLHPDDLNILAGRRATIENGDDPPTNEIRLQQKNGEELIVTINSYQGSFMDDENSRIVHIHDVTAQKANEAIERDKELQLRQSQKMEAIGTLAGGIAHDFNNMLMAIVGYTEMAQDEVEEGSLIHKNLDSVLLASERARDLVKQILAFGRQDQESLISLNLESSIRSALTLLRQSISTSIEINASFNVKTSVIFANETQVQQIIINLFSNAADAIGSKQGTINLTLDDIDIKDDSHSALVKGAYLKLVIKDDGVGMTPEVAEKAFNPFYTTKATGEGTGLGLYLVYSLIKAHGANVELESSITGGTCFTIYYPKYDRTIRPTQKITQSIDAGSESILIADDDDMILDLLEETLISWGYKVVAKQNGIDALEAYKANPDQYELVISDVQMPKMSGKELATEILRLRPKQKLILCSGYSQIIGEEEALTMGVKRFLTKPVSRNSLTSAIRSVIDEP